MEYPVYSGDTGPCFSANQGKFMVHYDIVRSQIIPPVIMTKKIIAIDKLGYPKNDPPI